MTTDDVWGSDVPISMPVPPSRDYPGVVDVGDGFVMTMGGIAHAIDLNIFEEYLTPTYAPAAPHDWEVMQGGPSGSG